MFKKYRTLAFIGILVAGLVTLFVAAPDAQARDQSQGEHVHQFHGDKMAYSLLIRITANTTAQAKDAVTAQLAAGNSIGEIAGAKRTTVLERYDVAVATFFKRQVTLGKLPQSVADARRAWYQRDARLMIDQPGLMPRFPGLHEVHRGVIAATVQVTGATRAEVKAALERCGTVSAIASGKGKTAGDVVGFALSRVDEQLRIAVEQSKLSPAQHDLWRAALVQSLNGMMTTPGLHFAGKECAL